MAGGRGKRGRGRAKGKRQREVSSDEETSELSISQGSSNDEDFVPSRAFSRFSTRNSRAIIAKSPVRNVSTKTTRRPSKLNPPKVRLVQKKKPTLSRKGENAMPHKLQRCTSTQPPEEDDLDSVPKATPHSSKRNLKVIAIPLAEPISGNGDNAMPREDDLISNSPVASSRSKAGDSQPIRNNNKNNNNTKTPNIEKPITVGSLDNWSTPISEHVMDLDNFILDQPVALVPEVVATLHQNNHVDVQGPTNFIVNGPHSHCLSRTNSNTSINVTEFAKQLHDEIDDEAESARDPGLEDVWGHKVKPEFAPLLRRIFDKHGDIAAQTDLKSPNTLSNYLQQLCRVCEHLERTKFLQIKRAELESMLADVSDFERAKLDVGWLRERLEYVYRAWNGYQQYCSLKEELGKYDVSIGGLEKKLDEYKSQLCDVQRKIGDVEGELDAKRAEAEPMRGVVLDTKARVKTLAKRTLVDGLF